MFLKSEPLKQDGHSVMLFELSALHRIEHLKFIAEEEKKLPTGADDSELYPLLVARNIRVGARVVAMSLWQGDMAGPDVDALHVQVMTTWPPGMIGAGELLVKQLSDMIPPEAEQTSDSESEDESEEVTAEKPMPAS